MLPDGRRSRASIGYEGYQPYRQLADSYGPRYEVDSCRPEYYDYQPTHQSTRNYYHHAEQGGQECYGGEEYYNGAGYCSRTEYYSEERYGNGQSDGRLWATQPGSRWYDGYSSSAAVQPPIEQEGWTYQQYHQPAAADHSHYWYGPRRDGHVQPTPSWQGYAPDYDHSVHYGQQAASYPAYYSAAAYRQEERQEAVYVPYSGYPPQQPHVGYYQHPYLTPNDAAANALNANASAFQPQAHNRDPRSAADLVAGIHLDQGTRPASASPLQKLKHPHVLRRPTPSPDYLKQAQQTLKLLNEPRQLLIVLDLNGTLLHRKVRGGASFVARPKVQEFIRYLLEYHKVMVWSSARPQNVTRMCKKLFNAEQHQELVAVWGRDTLRIPGDAYNSKVQVYKQLPWVWMDKGIQETSGDCVEAWDQSNTVLIDDSVEKAAGEPHNLLCLEEFEDRPEQRKTDVLGQVVKYLETLKYQKDVSASMRLAPFAFNPAEKFDWRI